MKTQMLKRVVFFFSFVLSPFLYKAQCVNAMPPCPINFDNGLVCQDPVDISWTYSNITGICSTGSASGVTGSVSMTCGCSPAPTNLCVTVTAVNGCALTPPVTLCWNTAGPPSCFSSVPLGCGCFGPGCCDTGTSILIWSGNQARIGVN